MIDIRTAGSEILSNRKPRKFYAFCGVEYGVKLKYIRALSDIFGNCTTFGSVKSVISMLETIHIIPLERTLYVVRYDADFIKNLSGDSEMEIDALDIDGAIVVIYESESDFKKCDKYLPNYTVRFDPVNPQFLKQYLQTDYPDLSPHQIESAVRIGNSYIGASLACESLMKLSNDKFSAQSIEFALSQMQKSGIESFKAGVAARDFRYSVSAMERSECDRYQLLYAILNTMLEIEKCLDNPKAKSWCSKYASGWTKYDAVTVFKNTYSALKESRSLLSFDIDAALVRILTSLRFSPALITG